ncbi:hypothetical protein RRG08_049872 [Elysia crispata]|uniref:Uncharacterized protein n=1 Tax=Elysia crispata TaxID=231223 RepID=A0AAE0XZQ1_9GAST|nr:hypothetical protein RRG08_049872 [Elysia crispata]
MAGLSGQNGPLNSSTDDTSKKQGTRLTRHHNLEQVSRARILLAHTDLVGNRARLGLGRYAVNKVGNRPCIIMWKY